MCFNKVEGPKTLRRHTLVKNSITQITEDFIKKSEKYSKKVKNFTRQKKKSNCKRKIQQQAL